MASFNFYGTEFVSSTKNALSSEKIEYSTSRANIDEYKISLSFENESTPEVYTLVWEQEQVDVIGFWSSTSSQQHNINPDWWVRKIDSRTASGMPLFVLYNKANINRVCVSLSDPSTPTRLSVGVVEETGNLRFKLELFSQLSAKMKDYEVTLRIDSRPIELTQAVRDVRAWWEELGYKCAYVPEGARKPLYSAWYSFHQRTIPDEIVAECKIAKEYGMDTLIVDDGWQTDDNSRGYAFCGDWEICESKIPDMQDFVDRIHALGMKFMVWFSVPFVGVNSKNYERFKGKYLYDNKNAAVLDPRFKDVRDFLVGIYVDYVKKYGWDGLKLDFIDSFRLSEDSPTDYENMDCISIEEGVTRLLEQASRELKAINPEFLIEFRQSYVGPVVAQYGNMLRVGDCPNDAIINRVHSLHLRLTSGTVPVHSDMLMWNKYETTEAVMYQLLACMFSVPQISIRFDNITEDHKRALKGFLSFWRAHSDTILDGVLEIRDIEANCSMAQTTSDKECVCVQYQQIVTRVGEKPTYIFNATGKDGIYLELESEREYEVYDMYGELYSQGTFTAGGCFIGARSCEYIKII